ncbi:hypothetical protein Vadar_001509 [Vaccinium darrowii]|uniref:Uncharacterized protein n=1 Tax=Vaccinium darrowii TaxID=229202 RepID=A0ACB7ZGV9_9ERIC|nr:hypothetical protein Vadar_001509 [Vaccinium darrowii]
MANWDDLPADIWRLIFQKVVTLISDHIPFSGVCKLWRSIGLDYRTTKFPTNVPALIIPGGTTTTTQTRRILAFPVGKIINNQGQDLPVLSAPHESLCRGSHQGWLVMVDKSMSIYLHNPVSGGRINLPPVTSLPRPRPVDVPMSKWYVDKALLSTSPSSSSSDCFVLVFYGRGELGLCKVGDQEWKLIEGPNPWGYIDGIFFRDEFYVVDNYGKIYISDQLDSLHPKVKELAPPPPHWIPYVQQWYLVESGGELHHIWRGIDLSGDVAESVVDDDIDGGQHDDDVNEEEDGGSSENDDESNVDDQNDHGGQHDDDVNEEEDGGSSENDDESDVDDQNDHRGQHNDDVNEEEDGGSSEKDDESDVDDQNDHGGQHDNDVNEEEDGSDDENPDAGSETGEFDEFDYDNNYYSSVRNFIQKTTQFRVFKLETSTGSEPKWIGVKDLDGGAIFLGLNQSFALSKSNLMGHRGDRIYFTDDDTGGHKLHVHSGHDMGIFNLEDSKFESLCLTDSESVKPPAVWITPMPW